MTTGILARFGIGLKWLLVAVALSSLGACASGAGHRNMTVMPTDVKGSVVPVELQGTIGIGIVTGGEETNPLWTSEVGNEEFKQALHDSLDGLKLYSGAADSRYVLDVHLVNLDQPLIGFDATVTSSVRYVLSERVAKKSVLEELVVSAHTAKMSDSWYGVERLKLANEGSIRDNIAEFISRLSKRLPEQAPESTGKPTT
jgi:hypothetical protein